MKKTIFVDIDVEYGYAHWIWKGSKKEYADIVRRWKAMKGLNCLVPVWLVFPGAKRVSRRVKTPKDALFCHLHESDDSELTGVRHKIPKAKCFTIDGVSYSDDELLSMKG